MTAEVAVAPTGPAWAHAAMLLSDGNEVDQALLTELRADPHTTVIDLRAELRKEIQALRPAPDPALLAEAPRWAWYSWRRTLASVLGPRSFRRLRLDRNRNKITAAEQDRFRRLTIGVVGLSVGHSIAHTLALEGLCGRLRLADPDTIELSNLNRIPLTVLDVGVNKAVAASRRIAELDPYLPVEVFPAGVTDANIVEFMDGLDLVVEECDSLDMKIRVRELARSRGIPVLMETSDRGLFDVERFDREPGRPLLHGLLGDVGSGALRGLSTRDKAPHVMRILQTEALSARMAASLVEIDRTVTTWPQLGGDVQLGGATVAAAVRRFGRSGELCSGRVRVDLESVLDGLRDSAPSAAPGEPKMISGPAREVPDQPLEAVVQAIRLAPSGGNSQPWCLRRTPHGVDVLLARARTSAMDVRFRGSYLGIGAAMFNAEVAAARHAVRARVAEFAEGPDSDLVFSLRLGQGRPDADLAELYPAMIHRVTNRGIGRRAPLDAATSFVLSGETAAAGGRLHLITEPVEIAYLADILAESDRIRFLTPTLHRQMMGELNWPGDLPSGVGLDVLTLGYDTTDLAKLAVARRTDVMANLAAWGVGSALGDNTRDRINASSALAVVTVHGDSPADYLRAGRAVERMWTVAGLYRIGVQPVSPVFLYARSDEDLAMLSPAFVGELDQLQQRFNRTVGLDDREVPALVLRLSLDPPTAAPSQRLDLSALMFSPDDPNE